MSCLLELKVWKKRPKREAWPLVNIVFVMRSWYINLDVGKNWPLGAI